MPSKTKLYAVPGSHPVMAVAKALELKGMPYKRIDQVFLYHVPAQRLRFGSRTVPAVVLEDGSKVQGSRAIMRELDARRPEPPLHRVGGDEAETWGDDVLQPLVRRLLWAALKNDKRASETYLEGVKLFPPTPRPLVRLSVGAVMWGERHLNNVTPEQTREDLEAFPGHLDRVDAWIADGTLGAETAADLQVFSSLRLAMTLDDLEPVFAGRPCVEHARRLFPVYPGRVSAGALRA
jgi:glutathione S-transferase